MKLKVSHRVRGFVLLLVIGALAVSVALVTAAINRAIFLEGHQRLLLERRSERQVLRGAAQYFLRRPELLLAIEPDVSESFDLEMSGRFITAEVIASESFDAFDQPNAAQRRLRLKVPLGDDNRLTLRLTDGAIVRGTLLHQEKLNDSSEITIQTPGGERTFLREEIAEFISARVLVREYLIVLQPDLHPALLYLGESVETVTTSE